jgi:N-acetylneuraminic acid mutarotase
MPSPLRPLAALSLMFTAPLSAATSAWEKLPALPVGNGGFFSAVFGETVVLAGGTTWQGETKLWLDQIWAYDPARRTWREAGKLPAAFAYPVAGQIGGTVWFAGGSSGTKSHRELWRVEADLQPRLVSRLDAALVYATGALIGTTLYAVGGTDDQAALERIDNTFRGIDLNSGQITRLPSYPEASLTTATAAALGDRLYVFGGARWDPARKTVVNHRTAHAYSITARRWETLPPLPHPGRGYTAVTLDDRHILIAGGYRNDEVGFVADATLYDVTARTYRPTTPLPYAAMVGLVKAGDWLYCLGGEDRKKHRSDAAFRIRWKELLQAGR